MDPAYVPPPRSSHAYVESIYLLLPPLLGRTLFLLLLTICYDTVLFKLNCELLIDLIWICFVEKSDTFVLVPQAFLDLLPLWWCCAVFDFFFFLVFRVV